MGEIAEAVASARIGRNDTVICRMDSGWVVAGNVQLLPGYCLLLPDPVVHEILGNTVPELHTHIFPRYTHEPDERRRMPVWFYDWQNAKKYSAAEHGELFQRLRRVLLPGT